MPDTPIEKILWSANGESGCEGIWDLRAPSRLKLVRLIAPLSKKGDARMMTAGADGPGSFNAPTESAANKGFLSCHRSRSDREGLPDQTSKAYPAAPKGVPRQL